MNFLKSFIFILFCFVSTIVVAQGNPLAEYPLTIFEVKNLNNFDNSGTVVDIQPENVLFFFNPEIENNSNHGIHSNTEGSISPRVDGNILELTALVYTQQIISSHSSIFVNGAVIDGALEEEGITKKVARVVLPSAQKNIGRRVTITNTGHNDAGYEVRIDVEGSFNPYEDSFIHLGKGESVTLMMAVSPTNSEDFAFQADLASQREAGTWYVVGR